MQTAEKLAKTATNSGSDYEIPDILKDFCDAKSVPENFTLPYITKAEINKAFNNLADKKSTGMDGIDSKTFKISLPFTVGPIKYIYNLCIDKKIFPDCLKEAKVIPIPKSKILDDVNNYRPISLLSILSKPLERHVQPNLLAFFEKHEMFNSYQSGFRQKHSCQTALSHLIDSWLDAINNKEMTGAVFLDLKKAFDLVDHNILLKKLKAYHIHDNTLAFLQSYLSDRTQRVFVHGQFSNIGAVNIGVPQGSILGPLLFIIFINDLPMSVKNKNVECNLFADDTSLHARGETVHNIEIDLQSSLNEVSDWCKENKMVLHPAKTKSMLITTRQKRQLAVPPLKLNLDLEPIEQVSERKFLGVTIDDQLNWNAHTDNLCTKLSRNIFLLSKLQDVTDTSCRKLFFHAHVKSHVDYVSNVWDGCSGDQMKRLNSIYRRAIKKVDTRPIPTNEKFAGLKILELEQQLKFNKCVLMHKILHDNSPSYLSEKFKTNLQNNRNSRNVTLILPLARIDLCQTSLAFSGAKEWNCLPAELKSICAFRTFKRKLFTTFHSQRD